jgi:hypothetical protein
MLVACRLAGLSALETYYAGSGCARNAGQTLASDALVPWLGGPRSRARSKRQLRSRRRVGRGGVCRPPPPVVQERRERAAKARRNGRGFCAPSALSCHGDNARYPIRAFCSGARLYEGGTRPAPAISRQKTDNSRHCATVGSVGGLGQCPGALQASFSPSTEPRFKAHDDHPLALQLEGAVGLGHQHLDDGAGASVAERVELAVGERNGRPLWACRVRRRSGLIRHCRPPWRAHANSSPPIMDPCRRSSDDEAGGGACRPPPSVCAKRRERAAKARRNRWVSSERLSHHRIMREVSLFEHPHSGAHAGIRDGRLPAPAISGQKPANTRHS